uniref:hypothetical protein n=1 Tax=Bacteroides cellulosilyticus TaxID=246787 RepID=UPI0032ED6E4B
LIALKDTHFLRNTELKAILFYLRNLNTFKEAAEKYNISCSTICLCCNDSSKHKHAGGLEWEYTIL